MKKKGHQKVVFKPYNMNQLSLPMSLENMIPPQHKVRIVNQVMMKWELNRFWQNIKVAVPRTPTYFLTNRRERP